MPHTLPVLGHGWRVDDIRVMLKKLEFIWHIENLEDDTLAKEVLKIQKEQSLPGLVRECSEWIKQYNLPDIFSVKVKRSEWKRLVKKGCV